MRSSRSSVVLVMSIVLSSVLLTGSAAFAQADAAPMTSQQVALACAPPPATEEPSSHAIRIVNAQDSARRLMFTTSDLLLIDAGTNDGLQLGQRFFIRRPVVSGMSYRQHTVGTATVGWLRIVSMNHTHSLAVLDHACDAVMENDYLIPFEMPTEPTVSTKEESFEDLDFKSIARVVGGTETRTLGAAGTFMIMDRGAEQGVAPGERFAVYRDLEETDLPLTPIGEAVVMTTAKETALVRIMRTRDAVRTGDFLVPRK